MNQLIQPHAFGAMNSLSQFRAALEQDGVQLPISENTALLSQPLELHGKTVPNRLCIQPLEGFDGTI